jgi:transcriptional regulator with XRE-family HTH domain
MITGRQISAARGLLQWSAKDLADKSGLNQVTIGKLESEAVQPQEKTLTLIANLFDKHGVEFLDGEGVRVRQNNVRIYNGKTAFRQLLDHIYETVRNGGLIRQFNFDDSKYLSYADDFMSLHLARMNTVKKLDAKVLVADPKFEATVEYCAYKYIDAKFEPIAPFYIYDDYVVLSLNDNGNKKEFVTIYSKSLAEGYRRQFDSFWKAATSKKKS